ncbi:MAG: hypothetical protein K9K67_05750 [Bacteriovoracaceae bacterium]|nr:hypothetical protein [Bacteriovoracaceae bacterium]
MKARHLAIAAFLLGTGWSTNVVYEYQTGQSLWRGVASEEQVEVSIDNVISHIEKLEKRANEIVSLKESIRENIDADKLELDGLLSNRDKDLLDLKALLKEHRVAKAAINKFLGESTSESEMVTEAGKRLGVVHNQLKDLELVKLSVDLSGAIEKAIEEKTIAQEKALNDINTSICEQNRELSSLSSKIEKLIQDKEKVVAEVSTEEASSSDGQMSTLDTIALIRAFSQPYQMNANDFFNASQPMGLASQQNPMGLDMNFLMMTKMLAGSNPFAPAPSINYAPVYNQQRTYMGMPSMTNFGRDAFMGNQQLPGDQQGLYLQGLRAGFNSPNGAIFERGNGLTGSFDFNQVTN